MESRFLSASSLQVSKQLHQIPRVWNQKESVWVHTEEAIQLATQHGEIVRKYGWNPDRVRAILRVHDIPELLTEDKDPRYTCPHLKHTTEEWAMSLLIGNESDRQLWYEYSTWESIDAQFAKAFDKLQFLRELENIPWISEYRNAMELYRKYFEPFSELLKIVDNPRFRTMKISPDNPHLNPIIDSLYQEAFEWAPMELQIKRATELGMMLDEYQDWIQRFPFLTRKKRNEAISLVVAGYVWGIVSRAIY